MCIFQPFKKEPQEAFFPLNKSIAASFSWTSFTQRSMNLKVCLHF